MNSDASPDEVASVQPSGIDLYWLPLGAGANSVRLNGLVFEAIAARLQHRDRTDLYDNGRDGQRWKSPAIGHKRCLAGRDPDPLSPGRGRFA